jgi:hypothetical protein
MIPIILIKQLSFYVQTFGPFSCDPIGYPEIPLMVSTHVIWLSLIKLIDFFLGKKRKNTIS